MKIRDEMRARGHRVSHNLVANILARRNVPSPRPQPWPRLRRQPPVRPAAPKEPLSLSPLSVAAAPGPDPALDRIHEVLAGLRSDVQGMRQQRRDQGEHGPMILRRLTELERLMRGDPGLAQVPRSTRRRPLGAE